MPPFDRLYTSFYCSAIVNIALCCTVAELLTLNNRDLEIWVILWVTAGRSNWYYLKVLVQFPICLLVTMAEFLTVYEIISVKV